MKALDIYVFSLMAITIQMDAAFGKQQDCVVGSWTKWSDCLSPDSCPEDPPPTIPVATSTWDQGRLVMNDLKAKKIRSRAERKQCMAAGTCPENVKAAGLTLGSQDCISGSASEYPCDNVDMEAFFEIDELTPPGVSADEANDIWGWTDAQTGDEYAIIGLNIGTSFVRITDGGNPSASPVAVGFIATQTGSSIWRDMKTIGNYVYIVSEASSHGMQIFDLTSLRGVSSMTSFTPDLHYDGFGNAHNIVANEDTDYIYVVGSTQNGGGFKTCGGGLHMVDVSDPLNPVYDGCFGGDGYTHDAQCVIYNGPDSDYAGEEVCFAYNEDTLTIVNVQDKSNPYVISKNTYGSRKKRSKYTHQGWLTEDHEVLFLDDEADEYSSRKSSNQKTKTYIWDVKDLDQPTVQGTHVSQISAIDHNQYVRGNLLYQANYRAGLRILDIDQVNYQLTEVAYFDVYLGTNSARFNGAWSVYPYYASDKVVVSCIERGLFILKPDYAQISGSLSASLTSGEQKRTRRILFRKPGAECPATEETRPCQPTDSC